MSAVGYLAIAIKRSSDLERQRHVGLLYKTDTSQLALLHLRSHFDFAKSTPHESYYSIPSLLDERLQIMFAVWLDSLWEANKEAKIPYSIEFSGRYLGENGELLRTGLGEGLTCATLVISAFSDYGLPLIDIESWPKFPSLGDKRWQEEILVTIERDAGKEHAAKQKPLIGKVVRFRPEHIAGAFSVFVGEPIKYKAASKRGEKIVDALKL